MLLQRAGTGTIPPTGFSPPPWDSLTASWNSAPPLENATVTLGPATVSLGHDDVESDDFDPKKGENFDGHEFGWDNEHPQRDVYVGEFCIEWRPITNGQYYEFYESAGKGKVNLPASWVEDGDDIQVRGGLRSKHFFLFADDVPDPHLVRPGVNGDCSTLACRSILQRAFDLRLRPRRTDPHRGGASPLLR
jgi:hypothetical protein